MTVNEIKLIKCNKITVIVYQNVCKPNVFLGSFLMCKEKLPIINLYILRNNLVTFVQNAYSHINS